MFSLLNSKELVNHSAFDNLSISFDDDRLLIMCCSCIDHVSIMCCSRVDQVLIMCCSCGVCSDQLAQHPLVTTRAGNPHLALLHKVAFVRGVVLKDHRCSFVCSLRCAPMDGVGVEDEAATGATTRVCDFVL
eukprot:m.168758 g.168758  ORF g.168758 m.168758 type:complete len:132 (-) comp31536_c2_seq2:634-1029(-)